MTITKRNNKYYCRFQIKGERHHYLCKGAVNKQQAEQIESALKFKLMQQQNGVIPRDGKKYSLKEIINDYINWATLNKISYQKDIYRLKIVQEQWKHLKYIDDLKPIHIEELKKYLLENGRSEVTINRFLEILSKMFNIGILNKKVKENLINSNTKFKKKNYSVRFLTKQEEKRLLKVLPDSFRNLVKADLNCGLRRENICELDWKQINMNLRYIEVLKNKGNKHIIIPINDKLYEILNTTPKEKRSGYVFINPNTGDRYRNIERMWKKWCKEANIENLRFHDLRHTVGTRMAEKGVPVAVIKEVLAHTDIQTTMRYIHITQNHLKEALAKL